MKEDIGITAGKIWILLREKKELALSQIPKALDEKPPLVYQALGWLAREDKIEFRKEGNKTLVALSSFERGE